MKILTLQTTSSLSMILMTNWARQDERLVYLSFSSLPPTCQCNMLSAAEETSSSLVHFCTIMTTFQILVMGMEWNVFTLFQYQLLTSSFSPLPKSIHIDKYHHPERTKIMDNILSCTFTQETGNDTI